MKLESRIFLEEKFRINIKRCIVELEAQLCIGELKRVYSYIDKVIERICAPTGTKDTDTILHGDLYEEYITPYESNELHYLYFQCIDSFRHLFLVFLEHTDKRSSIANAWKHQENEVWYPPIELKLTDDLPRDIENLDSEVIIYRGANQKELICNNYGQSWSLCEKVAERFAWETYDFDESERIVMKASIPKGSIVMYEKSNISEKEVVVNPSALDKVSLFKVYPERK